MSAEPTYPAPPATKIRISLPYCKQLLLGYFIGNDGASRREELCTLDVISCEHAWANTLVMRCCQRPEGLETARAALAVCQLCFSFTNAGMHLCRVFPGGKLVKQLLILVHNAVPVVEIADPI